MTESEAALVRAIRRALDADRLPQDQFGAHVMFRVDDIYQFATALVREGVTANDEKEKAA